MTLRVSKKHDLRLNLSLAKMFNGARRLWGSPRYANHTTATGTIYSQEVEGVMTDDLSGNSLTVTDDRPYIANDDEWRDRLPRRGRTKIQRMIKRIIAGIKLLGKLRNAELPLSAKWDMLRMGRELTPTERSEINERESRNRLDEFHRSRSRYGEKVLIESLARMGYCNRIINEGNGREVIKNKIRFDRVEFSPIVYRYHVDARRLPWKVNIMNLYEEGVCTTLSASVQHPVRAQIQQIGQYVTGLWYEIEIAGALGIPNKCYFADLLPLIPDSAPPLSFLLGYGENKRPYWRSLEDMPHFLGGGQTMGGKSNMMHVMICTFIARNKPDDVRLVMIDLKFDGIELGRYEGVPHLITDILMPHAEDEEPEPFDGIAHNPAQAIAVLEWAVVEGNKRGKMFKNEKIQNLKLWNRRHKTRHLPEIVICIDELALLRLDPEYGSKGYDLIRELSSTARASGIHLMAFTQSSNKRVIDEIVKVNFPGRVCFSVPDAASSVLFIGNGSAINLMPAGRAVYKHGTDHFAAQTPLIEASEVQQIVNNAKAGKQSSKLEKVHLSPEEIIEWSIEDNNSSLAVTDVFFKFGQRLEKSAIEALLKDMEGCTFIVGDRTYQVLPGISRRPRIVVRISDNGASVDQKSQDTTQDTNSAAVDTIPKCPYCETIIDPHFDICQKCGAPIKDG